MVVTQSTVIMLDTFLSITDRTVEVLEVKGKERELMMIPGLWLDELKRERHFTEKGKMLIAE